MMSKVGFSTCDGPAATEVSSLSAGASILASISAALMAARKGDCIESLRSRLGIELKDFEPGDCRTRGLKISVGAADREEVWIFLSEPNIDFCL
jgi:hypothetical protein